MGPSVGQKTRQRDAANRRGKAGWAGAGREAAPGSATSPQVGHRGPAVAKGPVSAAARGHGEHRQQLRRLSAGRAAVGRWLRRAYGQRGEQGAGGRSKLGVKGRSRPAVPSGSRGAPRQAGGGGPSGAWGGR